MRYRETLSKNIRSIFLFTLAAITMLQAQNFENLTTLQKKKIDPLIRQAVVQRSIGRKITSMRTLAAGSCLPTSVGEATSVLIQASSDIGDYIRSIGGIVGSQHGNIYTATLPIRTIADVGNLLKIRQAIGENTTNN